MAWTSFKDLHKDATSTSVHTPTNIGNEGKRRSFKEVHDAKEVQTDLAKFQVKKADEDQRLIFGWASIVTKGGQAVIDKQDDIILVEDLEKAFYDFVLYSRDQGHMHVRKGVGRLVECMVFTKQKQEILGIDLGFEGAWVGFRVDDPDVWAAHKRGELPEFSIGGAAVPIEVEV